MNAERKICPTCHQEIKTIFVLRLNDMRFPKIEQVMSVFKSTSRQTLQQLLDEERVETYQEPKGYNDYFWVKSFKKGGPLEWFNTPHEWKPTEGIVEVLESEEGIEFVPNLENGELL